MILKRITKLGWLTIALIIFLILTGMSHLTKSVPKQAANQLLRETEIQPKEHIPSKYPNIQLLLETKEIDGNRLSIETPVTESETVNDEIKQWIEKQKTNYLKGSKKDGTGGKQSSLRIALTTDKITDSYYQIQFTTEETRTGNHTHIFNADIENDRTLSLQDIFKMNEGTLSTISEQAKENKGHIGVTDNKLDETLSHPENWIWSIDSEAFTLYIDVPDESGKAKSPAAIAIPLDALYLNVNDDIAEIIDLSEEQQQDMNDAIQEEKERIARVKKKKEEQAAKERAKQKERNKKVDDPNGKYVALTFDDGPSAEVTPHVLDTLSKHGAVATFFMLGNEVDTYPNVAKRVADEGHEIGNHTRDHKDLTKLGPGGIHSEISDTSNTIKQATGVRPYLVRAPYGAYNDAVLHNIANNGNALALWSVDSLDWKSRNANAVYNEVIQNITSGAIVLMHDIHPTTADALPELLTSLEKQGYQFVTVSQLMELQGLNGTGPYYGHTK